MLEDNDSDTYSTEYCIDKICDFINSSRYYQDILFSLRTKPDIIIKMAFLDNPVMVSLFSRMPEDFTDMVKTAFLRLSTSFGEKSLKDIKWFTKIEIAESTQIKLHGWGADLEGVPVSVDCQIVGVNKQETYIKFAEAFCSICSERTQVFSLQKPPRCPDEDCDGHKKMMTLDKSTMKTGDIRTVVIQEPIEESHGRTPDSFDCLIKDHYALQVHIGQRIRLIGTLRSYPQRDKVTNQILINAISLYPLDNVKEIQPTDSQIQFFTQLKEKPDYLKIISESIAPEILHENLAKMCVLISMISSPQVDRIIGMIHTFLAGNPGQGKTRILEYVLLLIKKSAMAVGGTMSGAGITVTMDTLPNRQRIPRAGIIPQCSSGVAVIDELNQIIEEDQGKMHQCMSSGWINYDKGGFHEIVEAMTTIIAGANPRGYTYDTALSPMENLNLSAALVDRFDFIVNMSKKKTLEERKEILRHINLVKKIGVNEVIRKNKLLLPEDLAAFITYCKSFNPMATDEADNLAMSFQLKLESIPQKDGTLPIDNRFYDSIKKISVAIARLHFSKFVLPEHVMIGIEIMKKCLLTFDMNVEAGQTQSGLPAEKKHIMEYFERICQALQKESVDGRFTQEDFCTRAVMYPDIFPHKDNAMRFFLKMTDKFSEIDRRYKLDSN